MGVFIIGAILAAVLGLLPAFGDLFAGLFGAFGV